VERVASASPRIRETYDRDVAKRQPPQPTAVPVSDRPTLRTIRRHAKREARNKRTAQVKPREAPTERNPGRSGEYAE
jgi:hypothetical protein